MREKEFEVIYKDVKNMVDDIKHMACDDEAAHSSEDQLHAYVLEIISKRDFTKVQIRKLAKLALKTLKIDFCRWRA